MSTEGGRTTADKRVVAGSIGVGGGALMAVGSFMPWLTTEGESFTGWDFYDVQNDLDGFPFMIDEMFKSTFDPFFTGGATLILGLAMMALAAAVLAVPERPLPARLRVHPLHYTAIVIVALASFLVVFINALSIYGRPDYFDVSIGIGFWLVFVGGVAGAISTISAAARNKAELAARPATVATSTSAAMPDATGSAPGWYADPYRRHQTRYWSGSEWTSHVGDAGQPSEDPVLTGR